uniref:Non-haem dioxygenase N-terminal domain-containing protein n=1 Tax=Kalanchoe fedtschenkoi TaxID=63787 RepID=A0A7N0V2T1_KALFE
MELSVIDLAPYLSANSAEAESAAAKLCSQVSGALKATGALLVRDPRCAAELNDRFIDLMERYFDMPPEFKRLQERPELRYQAGVLPEGVEVPRVLVDRAMQEELERVSDDAKPIIPKGPDNKCRYMWRIGARPLVTRFKELNSDPVIPEGFDEWKETMNSWGYKIISTVEVVAEMAAIGFGLPKDAFTSLMKQGPHKLAPTGSNLQVYGQEGTVLAGYHYDLNFLTIHGRSRFPGLNIWYRNGQKVEVKVPEGCLLIQAGKQIEYLTAGECSAGMHEVVVTRKTVEAIKLAVEQNRSLWRVSSTVSDIKPIPSTLHPTLVLFLSWQFYTVCILITNMFMSLTLLIF